jgi:hypothetical protein
VIEPAVLAPDIDDVVKKVRKIVRVFRQSPVKNDTLQKYAKQDLDKELTLLIDSKTRWSSLLAMLQRFLKMKVVVPKALIDHGQSALFLSDPELSLISELVEALEIVECGTRALCRRDATLSSGDLIFEFMIQKLNGLESQFAVQLGNAVQTRIEERRLPGLAALQGYLENPVFLDSIVETGAKLFYPGRNDIAKLARDQFVRLFVAEEEEEAAQNVSENEEGDNPRSLTAPRRSRSTELSEFMTQKKMSESDRRSLSGNTSSADILKALKREMAVYEATGKKPSSLEQLRNALASIPPTSTEAERAFSALGLFITKLRTCLSDKTVDNLFLLRTHFLTEKIDK